MAVCSERAGLSSDNAADRVLNRSAIDATIEVMKTMVEVIRRQSEQLFDNIGYVLDYTDDDLLARPICRWPLWRQIYHLLHSMDQWFINPFSYTERHPDGAMIRAINTPVDAKPFSRAELREYRGQVEEKIRTYLAGLTDAQLLEYPEDCPVSRLDLILGQFRHVMYHVGMLHGCLVVETGEIPEYRGLGIGNPPTTPG